MAAQSSVKEQLAHESEIEIVVTGRKSQREITVPIWFVVDKDTLYLLPVKGSDTQWFKNALQHPTMRIKLGSAEAQIEAMFVNDAAQVEDVVKRFRQKYGAGDVKKYYSKFDVAVMARVV
jgi:hypothetical protein